MTSESLCLNGEPEFVRRGYLTEINVTPLSRYPGNHFTPSNLRHSSNPVTSGNRFTFVTPGNPFTSVTPGNPFTSVTPGNPFTSVTPGHHPTSPPDLIRGSMQRFAAPSRLLSGRMDYRVKPGNDE